MLTRTDNDPDERVEVVLRFLPSAVKRLKETTWHPTQTIQSLPDGSCLFRVQIFRAGIDDFIRWIHSWGAAVEVLQPEELRKKMIEEIQVLEKMYRQQEQELLDTLNTLSFFYSSSHSASELIQRMGRVGRPNKTVYGFPTIDTGESVTKIANGSDESAGSPSQDSPVLDFLETARSHLNQHREERLYQARTSFKISLIALLVGLFLICVGIFCVFLTTIQVGIVTTISGALADFIGIAILRFNKETNDRLDITTRELNLLDRTSLAMQYIERISDLKERNEAIKDLTKKLYTLLPEQNNS